MGERPTALGIACLKLPAEAGHPNGRDVCGLYARAMEDMELSMVMGVSPVDGLQWKIPARNG